MDLMYNCTAGYMSLCFPYVKAPVYFYMKSSYLYKRGTKMHTDMGIYDDMGKYYKYMGKYYKYDIVM